MIALFVSGNPYLDYYKAVLPNNLDLDHLLSIDPSFVRHSKKDLCKIKDNLLYIVSIISTVGAQRKKDGIIADSDDSNTVLKSAYTLRVAVCFYSLTMNIVIIKNCSKLFSYPEKERKTLREISFNNHPNFKDYITQSIVGIYTF